MSTAHNAHAEMNQTCCGTYRCTQLSLLPTCNGCHASPAASVTFSDTPLTDISPFLSPSDGAPSPAPLPMSATISAETSNSLASSCVHTLPAHLRCLPVPLQLPAAPPLRRPWHTPHAADLHNMAAAATTTPVSTSICLSHSANSTYTLHATHTADLHTKQQHQQQPNVSKAAAKCQHTSSIVVSAYPKHPRLHHTQQTCASRQQQEQQSAAVSTPAGLLHTAGALHPHAPPKKKEERHPHAPP